MYSRIRWRHCCRVQVWQEVAMTLQPKNYLQMAGVDTGSIDYSPTLNQRQLNYTANQLALNNRYRTTGSGSSRTSRTKSGNTSSGSGKTGTTGFTNSQLQTMATKFSGMKKTDPLYDFYQQTLTDAGWLKNSTAGSNGTSGQANTRSSPLRSGLATARGMQARGYSLDDIAGRLLQTALRTTRCRPL